MKVGFFIEFLVFKYIKRLQGRLQNEKKETQVSFLVHSFINQVARSYRKDAIAKAKKGKNNLRYCLNSIISSNYLFKEFKNKGCIILDDFKEYVKLNLDELVKDTDLSKFIL